MPKPIEPPPHVAVPFAQLMHPALELVGKAHRAFQNGGLAGLPTGLAPLNDALGGIQTGLHILAAEPGAGKTALALQICRAVAAKKNPALYVSFDELPTRLALKCLAARSRKPFSQLANGVMAPDRVSELWVQHAEELAALSFLQGDARISPSDLTDQLRVQMDFWGQTSGLLVIDYLQPWAAAMAAAARVEIRAAVGDMALALRKIAIEADIPVLVVSAQNRAGQGTAQMASLRESSDLEYGADSILMLTKSDDGQGASLSGRRLHIAKNRFGPSGLEIPLVFDGLTQTMTPA